MGKKVLVIGAARSGVAVSNLLLEHHFQVVLTDTREENAICKEFPSLKNSFGELKKREKIEFVLGNQIGAERICEFERIVTSPGVPSTIPIIVAAEENEIPVISEVELAYLFSDTPFIGITGTNGKTTTTTLTGEIFKSSGRKTFVVGNIGDPISNYVGLSDKNDIYVTELGSFQLSRCYQFHPVASAILNLSPDHLDRHKTLENYYQAKMRIFMNQTEKDTLVLNADDEVLCELCKDAKAEKIYFSIKKEIERGAFLKNNTLILRDQNDHIICSTDELGIKGPHNVMNALAAVCLSYFNHVSIDVIRKTLMTFKGVEHRQERFAEYDGVEYINDSKGTNTDATITALKAMTKPTILIAGGYDKKEDYTELVKFIKQKVKLLILLGATADQIEAAVKTNGFQNFISVDDYDAAVRTACDNAEKGDVVLLSPACASWDMFDNYEDRGRLFKSLVHQYGKKEK